MKLIPAMILTLAASPALAHPGHVGEGAGHDHIVAAIAVVVAVSVALFSMFKARNLKKQSA